MIEKDLVSPGGIAWGAALAGALVALALQLVLAVLALGLGLGAVGIASDAESGVITGAMGVWWTVTTLLALFLGGWTAGRIAGGGFSPAGALLGVLVWAIVTLASFWLLTTAVGTVAGGPLAVAAASVYGVLGEVEARPPAPVDGTEDEELAEARAEAMRGLAARAEEAIEAGLWAAFTLLLGAGAAVAGAWIATEPPAWARPRGDRFRPAL